MFREPSRVSFTAAALTGPLAGAYKGLIEYSQMRVGEDVVIIRAGSMGLLVTQIARAAGAGRLVLIDVEKYKLEHALKCGASHVVNSRADDPVGAVRRILPKGPDIVFEAAGVLEAASLAFRLCRKGTRVNMFGVIVPGTIEVSPATIHFTEIRMDASFSVTPRVMARAIDLVEKGLVNPEKIVTHRLPLARIREAMDLVGVPEKGQGGHPEGTITNTGSASSEGSSAAHSLPTFGGLPVLHSGTAPQAGRLDRSRPVGRAAGF